MQHIINQFVQTHKRPRLVKPQKGEKVLVLAPHPDDEVIGAGGTLLKHAELGNAIQIVFITDGRKGRTNEQSVEETIDTRIAEGKEVCARLGAGSVFLNCVDGEYIPEANKIEQLREIIQEFSPSDIFIPHTNDAHRDHFMTNLLFFESIRDSEPQQRKIWEYEVWAPLTPNVAINISSKFKEKSKLMSVYQSQLKLVPYQEIMEGLNKYRVALIPLQGITYIESFDCLLESDYQRKLKLLRGEQ